MQKRAFKIQLPAETEAKVRSLGQLAGDQSGNTLAAQVLWQFAQIAQRNPTSSDIWHAISRISGKDEPYSNTVTPKAADASGGL